MRAKICRAGRWLAVLPFLLLLALFSRTLSAHGGGSPQLVNEPVGPYLMSVWTNPDPARVGTLHVTVSLAETNASGGAGDAVLGAGVRVVAVPPEASGLEAVGGLATHSRAANRLFYESDLTLAAAGLWRLSVEVDGPAGLGSAAFELQVLPEAQVNGWILGAAVAVVVLVGAYLQFSQRRPQREAIHS